MKKLSNTEAELKKIVVYKKVYFTVAYSVWFKLLCSTSQYAKWLHSGNNHEISADNLILVWPRIFGFTLSTIFPLIKWIFHTKIAALQTAERR